MKKACIQCGKDARRGEVNNVKNVFCAKRCQVKYYLVGLKDDALNINDDNLLGLVTSDGSRSTMSVEMAEKIPLLKKMMEDNGSLDNYIPLSGVDSRSLNLVRQFIDKDKIIDFIDKGVFLNLLKAADYLLFDDLIYYLMYPWIYEHDLWGLETLKKWVPVVVFFHIAPLNPKLGEYADATKSIQMFMTAFARFRLHTGFVIAARLGNVAVVEALLKRNTYINPSVENDQVFRYACDQGDVKMVEFLLTVEGINPSIDNNFPTFMASKKGYTKVVELLLNSGRNINPNIPAGGPIIMASKMDMSK
jgi:Ankyrin repeats (3 copies)/Skp1 family, tetramerisation domain